MERKQTPHFLHPVLNERPVCFSLWNWMWCASGYRAKVNSGALLTRLRQEKSQIAVEFGQQRHQAAGSVSPLEVVKKVLKDLRRNNVCLVQLNAFGDVTDTYCGLSKVIHAAGK
jgi:hypothetical protein